MITCYKHTALPAVMHEIIYGHGRKSKSIQDGLQVAVCMKCHRWLHDNPDSTLDRQLHELAQRKYLENHTLDEWMQRYGTNYINGYYHDYYDFEQHIRELGRRNL